MLKKRIFTLFLCLIMVVPCFLCACSSTCEHVWGEYVITREPTCSKEGQETATCTLCGKKDNKLIAKTEHTLVFHSGKASTHDSEGYPDYYTCSKCSYTTYKSYSDITKEKLKESGVDITKFSLTLQNVLKNEYYVNTVANFVNNKLDAIPYKFLEDKGYNVNKIKSGDLYCYCDSYIDGNDLYIECKAEKEATTNYLGNYLIKYTLTNQEKDELNKLYVSLDVNSFVTYVQAPFFIQEISYTHTPTLISEAFITKESLNNAKNNIEKQNYTNFKSDLSVLYIGDTYYDETCSFIGFRIHAQIISKNTKTEVVCGEIKYTGSPKMLSVFDNKKIMTYLNYFYIVGKTNRENFESNQKSYKFYNNHGAFLHNILTFHDGEGLKEI